MNQKAKGYLLGAAAAASYGMNPLFALPLYGEGMSPDSVLFFRYLLAIPLLGAMLKARGRGFELERRQMLPLAAMGLLMAVSSLTLFESYNYMDVGIASTLLFVYPVMVTLIMVAVCGERPTWRTGLCMVFALGGIFLLRKSGDGAVLSVAGTVLVMASSLSYAVYIVAVNRGPLKEVPTLKVTFYVLLSGVSLFAVRLWNGDAWHVPDAGHWYLWANLLGLAVFPTAVSFLCTTGAIQRIGSTPTALLGALEPVTAVVIGTAVFGETVTTRVLCGLALIVAAVTLVVTGGSVTAHLVRFRKLFPRLPLHRHKRV